MRATVLIDNIGDENIRGEWGLSFFIEYKDKKILLDAGSSGLFSENAEKLGIRLDIADYAVLSHAHYDHADGMAEFFRINSSARLYLREACRENCYDRKKEDRYIGISRGFLEKFSQRLKYVTGRYQISEGVWLLPHTTENLYKTGINENMYLLEEGRWIPDSFEHEQSLVFETPGGLVVFNSCSHGGADHVIREAEEAFPGQKVRVIAGGFHLYNKTEEYIRNFAGRLRKAGAEEVYTGHCTGDEACGILREELGDMVHILYSGMVMEF